MCDDEKARHAAWRKEGGARRENAHNNIENEEKKSYGIAKKKII